MACRPYNTGRCLLLRLFNPSKLWGSLQPAVSPIYAPIYGFPFITLIYLIYRFLINTFNIHFSRIPCYVIFTK